MKIRLEKLDNKFKDGVVLALNDNKIRDNLRDLPYPYTEEHALDFINSTKNSANDAVFAIVIENKYAGCISACRQQNIHFRTAEIGYYVIPEFWNRGVATTALKLLTDYIFENTDIIRLYAEPFAKNLASCRVLEKAGFVCEGTLKNNAVKDGKIEDMKIYALIKETC